MQSASCHFRLYKDITELLSTDFECSSASVLVHQTTDSISEPGSISFQITVKEGPYRGGAFNFALTIPPSYPFKPVEIWALHPIWHPNIEPQTGKVGTPIEWSPVITLTSLIRSVQMMMLEPTNENPLNIESCSSYLESQSNFENLVQNYIRGGVYNGVHYSNVSIRLYEDDYYEDDYYYEDEEEEMDALSMIRSSSPIESKRSLKRSACFDESHQSIVAYGVNKKIRREAVIDQAWTRLSLEDHSMTGQEVVSSSLKNQRQSDSYHPEIGNNFTVNFAQRENYHFH